MDLFSAYWRRIDQWVIIKDYQSEIKIIRIWLMCYKIKSYKWVQNKRNALEIYIFYTYWLYWWHRNVMVFLLFVRVRNSYINLNSPIANSKKKRIKQPLINLPRCQLRSNWWFNTSISFYLFIIIFFIFVSSPISLFLYINIHYTTHLHHNIWLTSKYYAVTVSEEFSCVWGEG